MTDSDDRHSQPNSNDPVGGTPDDATTQYGLPQDGPTTHQSAPQDGPTTQYSAPDTGAPQYGAPQNGGREYGAPEYGAPQGGTPQYPGPDAGPAFDQTQYGGPQYGGPQDGMPGHGGAQPGTPQDGNAQFGAPQFGAAPQYGAPQYGAPQFGAAPQYGTPQYGTPQYGAGPQYGAAPHPGMSGYGVPMTVVPKPPTVGEGFRWAWSKFSANAGTLIGAAVVWAIILAVAALVISLIVGVTILAIAGAGSVENDAVSAGVQVAITATLTIIMVLFGALALSCWLNGTIAIADGRQVEFSDFFRPRALGPIIAVSIILGVVSALCEIAFNYGLGLSWVSTIVSIVIGLLTMWMVYVAADQRTDVSTALSSGLSLSTENLAPTIIVYLLSALLSIVGFLLLIVGLLVTVPLSGLLMMYYLRSLTQRPIAAEGAQPGY